MNRRLLTWTAAVALTAGTGLHGPVLAGHPELEAKTDAALASLTKSGPVSDTVARSAKEIQIFQEFNKGGLMIGATGSKGVLRVDGRTEGSYQFLAASYCLQAGIEKFGYVMFQMADAFLEYIRSMDGWKDGVGPQVAVADEGTAQKLSTTNA